MKINPITNPDILRSYKTYKMAPTKVNIISSQINSQDAAAFSEKPLIFSNVIAEAEFQKLEKPSRIENITDAVKRGEYKIGSDRIADKILERALFSQ